MRPHHIIFAVWVLLTMAHGCHAKPWRGIIPLKSTKADVERLLGRPAGDLATYDLPDSSVDVVYATCKCDDKCGSNDYDVPLGTVILIRVGLKGVVKISDLHVDLSKFKKETGDPDVAGNAHYVNREEGFALDTGGDYVSALTYMPEAKHDYLRCRHSPSPQTRGKDWRGIIPLKSTRADVERVFGRPTGPLPTYYLSDSTVTFWYSHCRCGDKCKDDNWNVPVDTVISIYVGMKGVVRLADLGLDLSQFKKSRLAEDVPESFIYSNAKEGLAIEGDREYAGALIYGPRKEDDYLRCGRNSSSPQTKANEWRGIIPLHSTRTDVERFLGLPAEPDTGLMSVYKLEREVVVVEYAAGPPCGSDGFHIWQVPRDTVLSIRVAPKAQLLFAGLRLDLSKYKVTDGGHVPGYSYYTDETEGIQYEVTQGLVMSITYFHTAKDEHLRCPCSSDKPIN